jgi:hypothetical protein
MASFDCDRLSANSRSREGGGRDLARSEGRFFASRDSPGARTGLSTARTLWTSSRERSADARHLGVALDEDAAQHRHARSPAHPALKRQSGTGGVTRPCGPVCVGDGRATASPQPGRADWRLRVRSVEIHVRSIGLSVKSRLRDEMPVATRSFGPMRLGPGNHAQVETTICCAVALSSTRGAPPEGSPSESAAERAGVPQRPGAQRAHRPRGLTGRASTAPAVAASTNLAAKQ